MTTKPQSTNSHYPSNRKRKLHEITNPCESSNLRNLKNFKLNSDSEVIQKHDKNVTYTFLKAETYSAHECGGAGNCLFLSISHQLPQTFENSHQSLRKKACDCLKDHLSDFKPLLKGLINESTLKPYTPTQYIKEKRIDGEYGDEPEIYALSKVLKTTIKVFQPSIVNGKLIGFSFRSEYKGNAKNLPILLNFIADQCHYQAIKKKEILPPKTQITKLSSLKNEEKSSNSDIEDNFKLKKVLKREMNQYYCQITDTNNRYNEILQFFQSGTAQVTPKRLKTQKQRNKWKIKTQRKYKYDEVLDRILELKKVSYEYLSELFPKPEGEIFTSLSNKS